MTADTLAKIVLDNVMDLNLGNLLKSRENIKTKASDETGVELEDFYDAILLECCERYEHASKDTYYALVVILTMKAKKYLREHDNANIAHLYDLFLFRLREISA